VLTAQPKGFLDFYIHPLNKKKKKKSEE